MPQPVDTNPGASLGYFRMEMNLYDYFAMESVHYKSVSRILIEFALPCLWQVCTKFD